ncbi:hypothetical protein [uncultured Aquimarina sp.]|uniref:DUF6973 domain-containing protein n=1 Tax=uncultured Aquimarina sp. TaxID=575652 RepID=UPI0026250B17|nr:hypothetical protein [uncultured Aquimarina sp.]
MKIRNIIRRFSFRQLFRLSGLLLQNPLYIIPTLRATKMTMTICDSLYGNTHHNNGKANAFRHALWNVLICQKTYIQSKNEKKSIIWAEKITDLHEKLAPNKAIAEAMDLHNNRLGRMYFKTLKTASEEETVAFLKEKTTNANLIKDIREIKEFRDDLIYLSDGNN